jgi:meiotic recombination protein SPO11
MIYHCLLREEATQIFQQEGMCSLLSTLVISEDAIPVINSFSHPRFLRYLVEQLHLPAYCLVDSDPYGFDILATYKFGSLVSMIYLMLFYLSIAIMN